MSKTRVSRLHKILAILFLALWLPVTSHCQLEKIPGLEFLECPSDVAEDSHCDDDACVTIESGDYKIQDNDTSLPHPVFTIVLFNFALSESTAAENSGVVLTTVPLEIPAGWQFS